MESSVVLLCCSNRASICSHALILLSQTRWIVMTGWCARISLQPFVPTRLDCCSLFVYIRPELRISCQPSWKQSNCLVWMILQKLQVFRAIPWLRKCASKRFGPCAGKHLQRGAMVNLLPRWSKMTKYFLVK